VKIGSDVGLSNYTTPEELLHYRDYEGFITFHVWVDILAPLPRFKYIAPR
jgi:hypothetical protein